MDFKKATEFAKWAQENSDSESLKNLAGSFLKCAPVGMNLQLVCPPYFWSPKQPTTSEEREQERFTQMWLYHGELHFSSPPDWLDPKVRSSFLLAVEEEVRAFLQQQMPGAGGFLKPFQIRKHKWDHRQGRIVWSIRCKNNTHLFRWLEAHTQASTQWHSDLDAAFGVLRRIQEEEYHLSFAADLNEVWNSLEARPHLKGMLVQPRSLNRHRIKDGMFRGLSSTTFPVWGDYRTATLLRQHALNLLKGQTGIRWEITTVGGDKRIVRSARSQQYDCWRFASEVWDRTYRSESEAALGILSALEAA